MVKKAHHSLVIAICNWNNQTKEYQYRLFLAGYSLSSLGRLSSV